MSQTDPLDDWLSKQSTNVHRRVKRLMEVVREAYPIGVPALIVKSQTDRLGDAGGYSFHLGTPDVVLRRICSWLLTHGDEDILVKLRKKQFFQMIETHPKNRINGYKVMVKYSPNSKVTFTVRFFSLGFQNVLMKYFKARFFAPSIIAIVEK